MFVALLQPVAALSGFGAYIAWLDNAAQGPSTCRGTSANGALEGGQRLPYSGENYRVHSGLAFVLGRTFVHSAVRRAVIDSYATISRQTPELRFVYAETGWPWGGNFAPHKTHRNGTAVDFHVPVRTLDGKVSELPTSIVNLYGYAIDFDRTGQAGPDRIDFQAMALHLLALDQAARAHGISIARVIFDVELQPKLFATAAGGQLRRQIQFNRGQAWVRHDEHYHVDFNVPCRP